MTIRSLHLWVGLGGVLVFLGTGLYLTTQFPPGQGGNEALRHVYTANHTYLLLGSLINLAVGFYRAGSRPGWRGLCALAGSVLMLLAPFVLLFAFFFEAPLGFVKRPATLLGVLMLLVGVLAQWPNRVREAPK